MENCPLELTTEQCTRCAHHHDVNGGDNDLDECYNYYTQNNRRAPPPPISPMSMDHPSYSRSLRLCDITVNTYIISIVFNILTVLIILLICIKKLMKARRRRRRQQRQSPQIELQPDSSLSREETQNSGNTCTVPFHTVVIHPNGGVSTSMSWISSTEECDGDNGARGSQTRNE